MWLGGYYLFIVRKQRPGMNKVIKAHSTWWKNSIDGHVPSHYTVLCLTLLTSQITGQQIWKSLKTVYLSLLRDSKAQWPEGNERQLWPSPEPVRHEYNQAFQSITSLVAILSTTVQVPYLQNGVTSYLIIFICFNYDYERSYTQKTSSPRPSAWDHT